MDSYSISQTAARTGFTASSLRFYESAGLIAPNRTGSGYRRYDEHDLDRLEFLARAKRLGLTLDEIAELLSLREAGSCAPTQDRMRDLLRAKITETQDRIAENVAFAADLQRVSAGLGIHTPDGPCDDTCGCTTDRPSVSRVEPVGVTLTSGPSSAVIACTLEPDRVGGRIDEWRDLFAAATDRSSIDGGLRARFPVDVDVASMARLAADEQRCCSFFTFTLTIEADQVTLDMTGPPDALPVIEAIAGAAA